MILKELKGIKKMKAYEFQTKINQGVVKIPSNYLNELEKYKDVRVIILTEEAENIHNLARKF